MTRNLIFLIFFGFVCFFVSVKDVGAQNYTSRASEDVINYSVSTTSTGPATANTPISLIDAIKAANAYNPRIEAARQQFAVSETDISLAESGKRLSLEATGSYGYLDQENSFTEADGSSISGETSNLAINLRQPLFTGYQTRNAVASATALAAASKVQIKAIEQQVFLEVATAYLDVQRDSNTLNLNLENLDTLNDQLEANEKRYALKDTSLTDVARSKSAVASALSRIADARASFAASRSTFFRLTGLSPENLVPLTSDLKGPPTLDVFLEKVLRHNASIISARHTLEASDYDVRQAKGARLPTIDFNSSLSRNESPQNFGLFSDNRVTTSASANISVRVPIYQAGQEFDNITRAKQLRRLRQIELTQTTADIRDDSRIVWDRLISTRAALASHEEAVRAAEIAAEGTRKIYRSGLISAIDLIDTEQILLNNKIDFERAKHDHLVTLYTLLSIMGEISYQ